MIGLVLILLISACSYKEATELFTKPRPFGLGETPDGSPTFRQGWEDGCDSGLGAYGGFHYRRKSYAFRQDITQIDNPEYYRAWKDAFTYCRWYVWNWARPWAK
jgi:hypothetical protein